MKLIAKGLGLLLVGSLAAMMLGGCATLCGEDAPAAQPVPPPKMAPVSEQPQPPTPLTTYTVEKCDDLWSIAGKPQVYGEPRYWPLLWDANGDQIKNPNRIKEGMVLRIPRDVSEDDKAKARKRAAKFPRYTPPPGAKRYCPPK